MFNFDSYKENAKEVLSYTSSDTPRTFIRALEDIVKLSEYGQNLEIENRILREDINCLKQSLAWKDGVITDSHNKLEQAVKEIEKMRMEIKMGECGINDWKDYPKCLSHPTRVKPKLKRISSKYRRHISKIITQEATKE